MTRQRLERLRQVIAKRQPDLTVLMENVREVHDFSAVVRTCDAVGVLDVHAITGERGFEANAATASSADKWVRVHQHRTLDSVVRYVRNRGMRIVVAHASPRAVDFRGFDYTKPTAILFGEAPGGVSEQALALVDAEVTVPMVGVGESLNVSVAAAAMLYEAQRQRELAGMYAKAALSERAADRLLFEYMHPDMADYYARHVQGYPPLDDDGDIIFQKQTRLVLDK